MEHLINEHYDMMKKARSLIVEDNSKEHEINGVPVVVHSEYSKDLSLDETIKNNIEEVIDEISDETGALVKVTRFNLYGGNIEMEGTLIEGQAKFLYTLDETEGIYITGQMIQLSKEFLDDLQKLNGYFTKFKNKFSEYFYAM